MQSIRKRKLEIYFSSSKERQISNRSRVALHFFSATVLAFKYEVSNTETYFGRFFESFLMTEHIISLKKKKQHIIFSISICW